MVSRMKLVVVGVAGIMPPSVVAELLMTT